MKISNLIGVLVIFDISSISVLRHKYFTNYYNSFIKAIIYLCIFINYEKTLYAFIIITYNSRQIFENVVISIT